MLGSNFTTHRHLLQCVVVTYTVKKKHVTSSDVAECLNCNSRPTGGCLDSKLQRNCNKMLLVSQVCLWLVNEELFYCLYVKGRGSYRDTEGSSGGKLPSNAEVKNAWSLVSTVP